MPFNNRRYVAVSKAHRVPRTGCSVSAETRRRWIDDRCTMKLREYKFDERLRCYRDSYIETWYRKTVQPKPRSAAVRATTEIFSSRINVSSISVAMHSVAGLNLIRFILLSNMSKSSRRGGRPAPSGTLAYLSRNLDQFHKKLLIRDFREKSRTKSISTRLKKSLKILKVHERPNFFNWVFDSYFKSFSEGIVTICFTLSLLCLHYAIIE